MTSFVAPTSVQVVLAELRDHGEDAKLLAGGTALSILMKQGLVQPERLVSLGRIPALATIAEQEDSLRIGATATHRMVETSTLVAGRFPVLVETLRSVATIRIRNMATLGGNLAHGDPALDPPVTLMALDARVRLVSSTGDRIVALDSLFLDYYETVARPDELLAEIQIPFIPARSDVAFYKFCPRTHDDYATVAVSTRLTLVPGGRICQEVRIALGAVGSTIIRAHAAEAWLTGRPADERNFREAATLAAAATDPLSDIRGSAAYKRQMVEVWVRRALTGNLARLTERAV